MLYRVGGENQNKGNGASVAIEVEAKVEAELDKNIFRQIVVDILNVQEIEKIKHQLKF